MARGSAKTKSQLPSPVDFGFGLLFDLLPDGVIVVDTDGCIALANQVAADLFGYSAEELAGMPVDTLIPERLRGAHASHRAAFHADPVMRPMGVGLDLYALRKDGSEFPIEISLSPTPRGGKLYATAIVRDISDRKQAEAEQAQLLRETEAARAQFVGLLESAPDPIIIVDRDFHIVLANRRTEEIFGYRRDELLGQPIEILVPERYLDAHLDGRNRYVADPQSRTLGAGPDIELFGRRKDGAEVPVEISLSPTQAERGELYVTAIVRDITERKEAELGQLHQLHQAQMASRRFEALVESAPDGVVIIDSDGRIVRVNQQAEKFFGYERDEILGQPVELLMPERFRGVHISHRQQYTAAPRTRAMGLGFELFGVRKDGSEFPVEISLSPLSIDDRLTVTAIVRDITERTASDQELQRTARILQERSAELESANRELESFAYSVSHDLRAPLRGIDGFSQALLEDYRDAVDERGKRYLRHVREAAQDMGTLIDDLLHLSRVSRGELNRTRTELSTLVRVVAQALVASDPERRVEWEIENDIAVYADERMMKIALENLLGNAWKFTSHRDVARIRFGRKVQPDGTYYFVQDNGAGFDMHYVDKLFGPFQRLHTSDEFEGTGIGLATAQRIMHRHGGRIWAEGAVDQGATFSFAISDQNE